MHSGASRSNRYWAFHFIIKVSPKALECSLLRHDFGHVTNLTKQDSFELKLFLHEDSTNLYIYRKFQPVQLSGWSLIGSTIRENRFLAQLLLSLSLDWTRIETLNFEQKHILMLPEYRITFSSVEQNLHVGQLNEESIFDLGFLPKYTRPFPRIYLGLKATRWSST